MCKVDFNFVKNSYNDLNTSIMYKNAVKDIGLWQSENAMFDKYIRKNDKILDLGCGAGRVTFGLYEKGYKGVQGIDISEIMVMNAKKINRDKGYDIKFSLGNAISLPYEDNEFDAVIFSFNGLMNIPEEENRVMAIKEVRRVLKENGIFIFTTHNRDAKEFENYWIDEKQKWGKKNQNPRLNEYGDMLIKKRNRDMYIYVPTLKEVLELLSKNNFKVLECSSRSTICEESKEVQEFSSECVFWIAKSVD